MGRYRSVLCRPGVATALLPYLVARVASAMVILSVLLRVQDRQQSFWLAGLVTGAFAAAVATAAPVLGRLVDRHGQTAVLVPCALLHPSALAVLVASSDGDGVITVPAAIVAGLTLPPLSACMRTLWPRLVDQEHRATAFAVESLVVEICELGGPLLVGVLVAVIDPGAAVLVAAALSGLGTLLFAATRASRTRLLERRRSGARGRSPLHRRGIRRLVLIVGLGVASVSALEVSLAAFATGRGTPGLTGYLIGAWVVGSFVAGWCYGLRGWRSPLPAQLPVLLALGAVTALAPLLAAGPWSMAVLLIAAGVYLAPSTAAQFGILSELAPDRRRTESFTWASTAAFLGVASGNLLAGPTVEFGGFRAGVLLSAALLGLAALTAYRSRHTFGLPRAAARTVPVELYELALAEVEQLRTAVRTAGRRHDELARQLVRVRQERAVPPVAAAVGALRPAPDTALAMALQPATLAKVSYLPRQTGGTAG